MAQCDHTSVGILVWSSAKLLMITRKRPPYGIAIPAGHVDDDTDFETAARRELREEVGLHAVSIELLIEGRKDNPCRREGGTWHYWKLYKATTKGQLVRDDYETRHAAWYSGQELTLLADRTKAYLEGDVSEKEWRHAPGLEPVMREWLSELAII